VSATEKRRSLLTDPLRLAGFDLVHWFSVHAVNSHLEGHHRLPSGTEDQLGLLVGNTRALWDYEAEIFHGDTLSPLDDYSERRITSACEAFHATALISFAHDDPAPPIQRIAHAAGFVELGPANLSVHPELGPWLGLRAVVTFSQPPRDLSRPFSSSCDECSSPCVGKFEDARRGPPPRGSSVQLGPDGEVSAASEPWLAIRDACPVGRAHRYSAPQLRYHYDKVRVSSE